jgi:hypothetical protein
MIFSKDTIKVGGLITVPDGFVSKGAGEIVGTTNAGIQVIYNKDGGGASQAFYAYAWLNQMYGDKEPTVENPADTCGCEEAGQPDDLNDKIPF